MLPHALARDAEIRPLTSFRAWAALLVFVHHEHVHKYLVAQGTDDASLLQALMYEGRVGVAMFFVLSGFLLTLRYHERLSLARLGDYLLKRVARIWPLYAAVLGLLFAFDLYKGEVEWGPYLVYATLTQAFFDDLRFRGINTAWSLTVEECFYLLLPPLLAATAWLWRAGRPLARNLGLAALVLLVAGGALFGAGLLLERQSAFTAFGFFGPSRDWIAYTICGRFGDFAVGILLGLACLKGRNALLGRPRWCDALIAVAVGGLAWSSSRIFYLEQQHQPIGLGWHLGNLACSAAIIYGLCAPGSWIARANAHPAFVYLGRVSFAFYLVHMAKFLMPVYRRIGWMELHPVAEGLLCYGAATLVAVVLYEAVEVPARRRILALAARRGVPPRAGEGDAGIGTAPA